MIPPSADWDEEQRYRDVLTEVTRKYQIAVDKLTEEQFVEALRQALPDFTKLVATSNGGRHGQKVIYTPYQEADRWKTLYHELLFSVESVHDGETRHQTALRYIRERETHSSKPQQDTP